MQWDAWRAHIGNKPPANTSDAPSWAAEMARALPPRGRQRRGHVSYNPDDVYDPLYPNDYERVCREQEQRMQPPLSQVELKFAEVETEKLSAEEAHQRRLQLLEAAERRATISPPPPTPDDGPKDVGMRIMQKMGWTEGKGLGAQGQGIVAPLVAKSTGKHVGVIVQAAAPMVKRGAPGGARPLGADRDTKTGTSETLSDAGPSSPGAPATRILKIACQQCPKSAGELQEELEESMCQFGSLVNVHVSTSDAQGDFTVFCEFEDAGQAKKACDNLHRAITGFIFSGAFASEEEYAAL
ncbi:RNA-binding protein, putative [Babesia caballi]|uniref:RNA-binding protein, putative n=1 Tax=Babesia caballi TaxID=5871 RepID=A0AAV4LRV5_BABCB|nr:RNA-binding protein, putative [Babesia caballi]